LTTHASSLKFDRDVKLNVRIQPGLEARSPYIRCSSSLAGRFSPERQTSSRVSPSSLFHDLHYSPFKPLTLPSNMSNPPPSLLDVARADASNYDDIEDLLGDNPSPDAIEQVIQASQSAPSTSRNSSRTREGSSSTTRPQATSSRATRSVTQPRALPINLSKRPCPRLNKHLRPLRHSQHLPFCRLRSLSGKHLSRHFEFLQLPALATA
jgi:hypothetical protein